LAAKRSGIKTIILCSENKAHIEEINANHLAGLEFVYVTDMDEVLKHTLNISTF
jgi:ATP-dependent Lon protease